MKNILVDLKKLVLLILICLIISPLFPYQDTEAASVVGRYFGGRITSMVPCSCNPDQSSQLTVVGPSGSSGTYLYSISTKVYARNSVKPGSLLLGKYYSGGSCLVGAPPECSPLPITKGTIIFTGTSL